MAEDWAIDVKKYAPDADDGVIAAIVAYCGISLRNRDSSLVSFTDPAETALIRENYLKTKLGLVDPDTVLDTAIANVGTQMKGDSTRNRVTVYYLLAQHFGKLGVFGAGAAATGSAIPLGAAGAAAAAAAAVSLGAAAPLGSVSTPPAPPVVPLTPEAPPLSATPLSAARLPDVETPKAKGIIDWLPLALLVLGALALLWHFTHKKAEHTAQAPAAAVAVAVPTAVVPAAPAPAGADVVEAMVNGQPMVSVYFDTAKSKIDSKFEAITGPLRTYISANPGNHLKVSGYNDPRGDAALNAKLSKDRAFAVRDALTKLGIAGSSIALVKPVDTSDNSDSFAHARRVDVTVENGPVPAEERDSVKP